MPILPPSAASLSVLIMASMRYLPLGGSSWPGRKISKHWPISFSNSGKKADLFLFYNFNTLQGIDKWDDFYDLVLQAMEER
jgi:hypothetical protein